MRRTPVFGDPKTDFVFQRIFGSNDHPTALLGFLNDILQLDEAHRITSVTLLARRDTLLRLLDRAGLPLTEDERTRIQTCTGASTLDQRIDNVLGAKTTADVLH